MKTQIEPPQVFGIVNAKSNESGRRRITFVQVDREFGFDVECYGMGFWNHVQPGDRLVKNENDSRLLVMRNGESSPWYYCTCPDPGE